MDGSQKLPQRLLGTIRDNLAAGRSIDRLALSVAGWMRYVYGRDEKGAAIDVADPLSARFATLADAHRDDSAGVRTRPARDRRDLRRRPAARAALHEAGDRVASGAVRDGAARTVERARTDAMNVTVRPITASDEAARSMLSCWPSAPTPLRGGRGRIRTLTSSTFLASPGPSGAKRSSTRAPTSVAGYAGAALWLPPDVQPDEDALMAMVAVHRAGAHLETTSSRCSNRWAAITRPTRIGICRSSASIRPGRARDTARR